MIITTKMAPHKLEKKGRLMKAITVEKNSVKEQTETDNLRPVFSSEALRPSDPRAGPSGL